MKKWLLLLVVICCSCRKDSYFDTVAQNDVKLNSPMPGEWLDQHKEKGQSFESFLKTKPAIPNNASNVIYLQPIGNFTATQLKQLELTREHLELFFQATTQTLHPISDAIVPKTARRNGMENNDQLLAGFILDSILIHQKHPNAIALMGICEKDLYPKPEWNFVFGLASYRARVGVSSVYRLQDMAYGNGSANLCLERLIKISSHEIGHMFGLRHCIDADCVMNGTNNIEETDNNPARLCSHCQRKLQTLLRYDNIKRLKGLEDFCKRNQLEKERNLIGKDVKIL
jgi:archaemetzincin